MINPRLRAGLVIAAIVVASGIAGAAIDRTVVTRRGHRGEFGGGPRRPPPPELEVRRRKDMLERLTTDLSLTPAQRVGIDSIFQRTDSLLRSIRGEMQPRLRQVFEQSHQEINARLDSAQRVKFAARRPHGPPPERR